MPINELAIKINQSLNESAKAFGDFQKSSGLHCPSGCGKCCLNKDVSCSPYELLPFALHLIETNRAEEVLEHARTQANTHCILFKATDAENGLGLCTEYSFRPFVCRAFGVAARHDKNHLIEYSICKHLKEIYPNEKSEFINRNLSEVPFIEEYKSKLQVIDPSLLDFEVPINQALVIMLEKVLLLSQLHR